MNESLAGINLKSGFKVEATFKREQNQIALLLKITNFSELVISEFEVQMKPNFFGMSVDKLSNALTIFPNQTQTLTFSINTQANSDNSSNPTIPLTFVMGAKTTLDIFYFNVPCMFHILLVFYY